MVLIIDLFGIFGMVLLLAAFITNIKKHTKQRAILYNGLNFIGALILCLYAYLINSLVFVGLQLIWAIIALYFLYCILYEKQIDSKLEKKISKIKKKKK